MTKGQLLAILYERLNYQSAPDAVVTTRLGNHLNQAHRMILRQAGLQGLRQVIGGVGFTSASGRNYYGLPPVFSAIQAITDRTNDILLQPLSLRARRSIDPGSDATGTPTHYIPVGLKMQEFRTTSGLWVVSAEAADTTPVIQVNGIRVGGIMTGDQTATLNGTTRTAIGAFTDWEDLTTVSLSAAATGLVAIYDAATNGNVISQIPIGHLYPTYYGITLFPIPTAAITYFVDGPSRIIDMDDTVDVPQLPEEYHDLLIPGAMMLEYEKTNDARYPLALATYREGLSNLKYALAAGPDVMPGLLGGRRTRTSRLGSMYPAD